ncbi:hypothetical protein FVEN_g6578 [Fusarium venenatum]|uniref:Rna polymerase n=1 Tax=Fusarium venenatum TaxID=56646 RepID=A0A2L2SZL4_9HYPO|nr:uncharacterized protein FVRRES_04879 [Fusarium venenatum]KAG8355770.1 hypothetical protein FVEN_g6578 [Fusarium venenatum]CEI60443.1 unnamed protein product [Fusarium venenatum]
MADTKVKVNGHGHINGNGTATPGKTPVNKHTKLWQLLALAKEVSKDVGSIEDYEKSSEERKALEAELEAKQGENKRLREFNDKIVREFSEHKTASSAKTDMMFAEFEQKYKTYESNKAAVEAMEKEVQEAREMLAAAEMKAAEAEKLKQRLSSSEMHAKNHAAEIREMNAECELHRSQMQTNQEELSSVKTKLNKAQSDLGEGILKDYGSEEVKKLRSNLQELSNKVHDFVNEYFNFHDGAVDSASEIQELNTRFPKIPLSCRTTKAAAKMRCAVADAVIAETLLSHIFVPFYVAHDMRSTASSMLRFFKGDERRETVYRCQILGSLTDSEQVETIQEDIVRKASNEVRSTLHPLVVAYKQTGFYNAVPALFRQAVGLWADAQRSRDMITAELPDEEDSRGAGQYGDYDVGNVATRKAVKGSPKPVVLAVLFPQFVCRDEVIAEGVVLRSDQAVVVEAVEEAQSNGNGNGDAKKKPGTRRRSSAEPKSPLRR